MTPHSGRRGVQVEALLPPASESALRASCESVRGGTANCHTNLLTVCRQEGAATLEMSRVPRRIRGPKEKREETAFLVFPFLSEKREAF